MKNKRVQLAFAIALLGAPSLSAALGWGQPRTSAVLGRPLDFAVPVRLEPGEDFAPECVDAEVLFGDVRVPGSQVSLRVEPMPGAGGERLVRVQTRVSVEEPIVSVQVATGCRSRLVRKFVAFADPPLLQGDGAALPSVASAEAAPTTGAARAVRREPSARAGNAESASAARAAAAAPPRRAPRPNAVASGAAGAGAGSSPAAPARASRAPAAAARATAAPAPRLRLDPLEPEAAASLRLSPELSAPAEADAQRRQAAAALWAAVSATPDQAASASERMQALEQSLQQLRAEAARTRESVEALQAQLRHAQQERYANPLVYALGALSAALAAALLWVLARRGAPPARQWWSPSALAESRRRALEDEEAAAAAAAPAPDPAEQPAVRAPDVRLTTGAAVFSGPAEAPAPSAPPPPAAPPAPAAPAARPVLPLRDEHAHNGKVSVEELIDLEQQAEFFVALGQEESAISLLQSHVQHHPDGSPLPYLKLMELHQQRGDRDAYEAVRGEFNQRFNAYAPAWEESLADGRSLEEYPTVISRLQGLWETPTRALEVLQASLLRRDTASQTFDLPAYRELLMLYSIARERVEHADEGGVDILLPFDEPPTPFGHTMLEPLAAAAPAAAREASPTAGPVYEIDLALDDLPAASPAPASPAAEHPLERLIDFEPVNAPAAPEDATPRGAQGRGGGRA